MSASRLGVDPSCQACGAGAVLSFDWRSANERRDPDDLKKMEPLTHWMELRRGSLFRCQQCSEVWHLDGNAKLMTQVEPGRLPLVLDWNRKPIVLPADVMEVLQHIGPTPPDVYGNGSERRVTPCEVTTQSGEIIETGDGLHPTRRTYRRPKAVSSGKRNSRSQGKSFRTPAFGARGQRSCRGNAHGVLAYAHRNA